MIGAIVAVIVGIVQENWTPFVIALVVEQAYVLHLKARVREIVGTVETPGRDLAMLGLLLARIEAEPFTSPRLLHLRGLLNVETTAAVQPHQKLQRLIELLADPA